MTVLNTPKISQCGLHIETSDTTTGQNGLVGVPTGQNSTGINYLPNRNNFIGITNSVNGTNPTNANGTNPSKQYIANYSYYDANGIVHSKDISNELVGFKILGISIVLMIFSIYLYNFATKLFRRYFDKKEVDSFDTFFTCLFYIVVFNWAWIYVILSKKDISIKYLKDELLIYPEEFVLGIMLSSVLLLGIGVFRFTLIAFNPISNETKESKMDTRFSFIGFFVAVISLVANFAQIWSFFK